MSQPLLVVNADDYGLTEGVSRAILRAHREGIVTSTSVLTVAPAFASTACWLGDRPDLGLGLHLAAVGEDPPLLSAREIPTLVDDRGHLDLSWRRFLPRAAAGRVDLAELSAEFEAQYQAFTDAGLAATHLDTHQHLHLWPPIGRLVLELATRWGIGAARAPMSSGRGPTGLVVGGLGRRFRRRARSAGIRVTDRFAGFDEGGSLALPVLLETIEGLAAGGGPSAELGLHPGEHGDADLARYRWGYHWGDELDAVCAPAARAAVDRSGFRLGTYADLVMAA
jgi:chitin disaccharide deacetylase